MAFVERYCINCVNYVERDWRPEEGEGCPLWDLHLLLDQYKACNEEPSPDPEAGGLAVTKFVLDYLIEGGRGGTEPRCSMFIARDPRRCPDTPDLFAAGGA